jgi:hypothetical protein
MTHRYGILLLFVQKIAYLDLCHTPIYEQFDTGDITAVIRREERDGFRDFVRTSNSTHRHAGYNARLELLGLFLSLCQAIEARCVDRARADGVDSDLAVFQLDCPSASERSYGGFGCVVNT